ncbi:MAG: glycosyltransferase [Verrucomicrobiota bacterium]
MKIDFVTDTFTPDVNGVAMTLGRMADGLRDRGHRVHVIHTGAVAGNRETRCAALPLPGYSEVRMGFPRGGELRSRWLKRRPDAVYVATQSPLGRSAVTAARSLGIGVASGFHTNFHEYIDQYHLGLLRPIALAYLKRFHAKTDLTLVPSADLMEQLHAQGFGPIGLLSRGVDSALFGPARRCENLRHQWGATPASRVAIVVGRMAAEKNLDLAVEAFEHMRRADKTTRFVMVGDGPVRERLKQCHPWIHFAGMLGGEELACHYASADVLVFPSETETFGNVVLEGLASGLACVAYDYAAAALHICHGVNGWKAAKGDSTAFLRHCLTAMRAGPDDPTRHAARQRALASGWGQVIAGFEQHLTSIVRTSHLPMKIHIPERNLPKFECRTVFLSDLHLGTPDSKADEVVDFLRQLRCERLVLNGDIIDGWALKRGGRWTSRHSRVIRKIIKMTEKHGTEVVYLRGNHDEILDRFLPLAFGKMRFLKEMIHTAADGKRYLVIHGDGFDSVSTNLKWLAVLGSLGYDFLLKINRLYNRFRVWRGKEYYSLSKRVKAKVKSAVCFVDRYEELLQNLARKRNCDGIICGHIHTPEDKFVGDIRYLNSGDWVESLTAIIEHNDGRMELVDYRNPTAVFRQTDAARFPRWAAIAS